MHECLKQLSEADAFWRDFSSTGYSKQVAITKQRDIPTVPNEAKSWYKEWYKKQSKFWGRSNKIAFSKWTDSNKEMCKQFCTDFFKILRRISLEAIPKEKTKRILDKYL